MLKFYKKTQFLDTEVGDFYDFDSEILFEELKGMNASCSTTENEITIQQIDYSLDFNEEEIRNIILSHGSKDQCDLRKKIKDINEFNNNIFNQMKDLDTKRIRAVCEGDLDWLKKYNDQAISLRSQIKKLDT